MSDDACPDLPIIDLPSPDSQGIPSPRDINQQGGYVHLLHELTAVIREDVGMGESMAVQFADTIAYGLARRNPGTYVYVPAVALGEREALHEAIRHEFNGRNMADVCRKYGVGKAAVYRAVARKPEIPPDAQQPAVKKHAVKKPEKPLASADWRKRL